MKNIIKLFSRDPVKMRILAGPFAGAQVYLNPANSKRKLFGLYENVLNEWLRTVVPKKQFAFDVGANTGYDTYGLAYLMSGANRKPVDVIGFEPEADLFPELLEPVNWPEYSNCNIEIVKKFAGATNSDFSVTLDSVYNSKPSLQGKAGVIKIDVEGHEVDVLKGSSDLLAVQDIDWLVEIHGKELIAPVSQFFCEYNRPFLIQALKPLPILGAEERLIETYWLTTL